MTNDTEARAAFLEHCEKEGITSPSRGRREGFYAGYAAAQPRTPVERSTVVSKPDAAIKVERFNLTDEEREELSINTRLSDIGNAEAVCKCGHPADDHWCKDGGIDHEKGIHRANDLSAGKTNLETAELRQAREDCGSDRLDSDILCDSNEPCPMTKPPLTDEKGENMKLAILEEKTCFKCSGRGWHLTAAGKAIRDTLAGGLFEIEQPPRPQKSNVQARIAKLDKLFADLGTVTDLAQQCKECDGKGNRYDKVPLTPAIIQEFLSAQTTD